MSNEETTTETQKVVEAKIVSGGSVERDTKNAVRYATEWGVVYVPKTQLAKLTGTEGTWPNRIRLTVEAEG